MRSQAKNMIQKWQTTFIEFAKLIFDMCQLSWQSHKTACILLTVIAIIEGCLPIAIAWFTKLIFDLLAFRLNSTFDRDFFLSFLPLLLAQTILLIIAQVAKPGSTFLSSDLQRKLTLEIQSTMFAKLNSFVGIAHFEDPTFYDIQRLGLQGAQQGAANIPKLLPDFLKNIIIIVVFLGTILAFSPILLGLVIIASIPQVLIRFKISRRRFNLANELSLDYRRIFYYSNLLSGPTTAKEIRLFDLGAHFLALLRKRLLKVQIAQKTQERSELTMQLLFDVFTTLLNGVIFIVVVFSAYVGRLSLGDVVLYSSAVNAILGSFTAIIFSISNFGENVLFFKHYKKLMLLPQPVRVVSTGKTVPKLSHGVTLHNISFRYTERHPWILRDLNLYIPAGKCLALVGLNGAGKTTLIKLLTRLYDPTEGQILWDEIDISEFDPQKFRQQIGVTLQDFVRYDISAYENIGLGNVANSGDITQIRKAAVKAGIHETLEQLPKGYETVLSRVLTEDAIGIDLSGGEWQKIALARMFMRDATLFILDEPTSALDASSEYDIYSRFVELIDGRTTVLISHRFSTVKMADVIAVLEDGRVTELGSHDELMGLNKSYARLYTMQSSTLLRQ